MFNLERSTQNLQVLASFKNKTATPELLKNYTGWGGLRKAVYTPHIYKELKKSLSDGEIKSLKQTLKNAYYTPAELVKFIYDLLQLEGFTGGNILEPSVGHGVFMEYMPQRIRRNSTITALDIDQVSSQMVKTLYPDVKIYPQGFETFHPEEQYDLVIGNPPYGRDILTDVQHPDLQEVCIHHYFVAKSMRLLKEGGILAMVLPSYFLDNVKGHVRTLIDREGGSLLAAYRLPDDLFQDAKVTIDLVFLTKGKTSHPWVETQKVTIGTESKPLNVYYHTHPHHILGQLEIVPLYDRTGLTCKRRGDPLALLGQRMQDLKNQHLARLARDIACTERQQQELDRVKETLLQSLQALCTP
ncbi:modification methylase TaqI [Caedimonas varicaedens]|jgi:predicted RNA methylase|uniref:Modification methylase TaqI n=1 Tax=Caedimonas varicaedens TaxID=1629334 RepID=A0A0K8MDV5_9PROT|nr:modification methylase TaqI [Caedimonas varicaedens]